MPKRRGLSFKERKQLGKYHRKIREAERRVNLAIMRRISELKADVVVMQGIDALVDVDIQEIKQDKKAWLRKQGLVPQTSPPF
jgi:hypothetical protein